jgi:hypothetical protein
VIGLLNSRWIWSRPDCRANSRFQHPLTSNFANQENDTVAADNFAAFGILAELINHPAAEIVR